MCNMHQLDAQHTMPWPANILTELNIRIEFCGDSMQQLSWQEMHIKHICANDAMQTDAPHSQHQMWGRQKI